MITQTKFHGEPKYAAAVLFSAHPCDIQLAYSDIHHHLRGHRFPSLSRRRRHRPSSLSIPSFVHIAVNPRNRPTCRLPQSKRQPQLRLAASILSHSPLGHPDRKTSDALSGVWRWGGWLLSLSTCTLLSLGTEAIVRPPSSVAYGCEDVNNYYASAKLMKGGALRKQLNSIVAGHESLSYKEVWDALKILDAAEVDQPESSSGIVEIYSQRTVAKELAGKPEGWNREHLWPRSYGLTNRPSLTDLHNIRPADANVNASRGNKYFGECPVSETACLKPANKEAAPDTETDKSRWAPPMQVRGDIARAVMYMAVRYGFNESNGSPVLSLSDSPSMAKREMGLLSTLLKWNEADPPSREEKLRNERICRLYQHNRNPFVDHPEYANIIWKKAVSGYRRLHSAWIAWINEFHYNNNRGADVNEFIEVAVGKSTDAAKLELVLYNGSNGKVYASLPLLDDNFFQVTNDSGSCCSLYTCYLHIQNGLADGIALVGQDGEDYHVIQFISYEGTVKATDGPAMGVESVDIGVRETDGCSGRDSLGASEDPSGICRWRKFLNSAAPGLPNTGQNLCRE